MAIEKANITFYDVQQCGYYQHRKPDRAEFGTLVKMLNNLRKWATGKDLIDTKLYEGKGDQLPTYLMDIKFHNKSKTALLTLWNQVPSTSKSSIASVMPNVKVGQPDVILNDIKEGSIPGFATYFWFVPAWGKFASIRFQHAVIGSQGLQEYLESFVTIDPVFAVFAEDSEDNASDKEKEVLGYVDKEGNPEDFRELAPKFKARMTRHKGQHDMILDKADKISRVEKNTMLKLHRPEDLTAWQTILKLSNMREPDERPETFKLKYRMTTPVTVEDVQAMIDDWKDGVETEWNDYGFMFKGDSKLHWLSHSIARREFELDIERNNDEVVNSMSLLEALNDEHDDLKALSRKNG